MESFDEVGINYITASAVDCYRDNPAFWVMRYLYGHRSSMGPAFARTIAIKQATVRWLYEGDLGQAEDIALDTFRFKCEEFGVGLKSPGALDEYDNILPLLGETCQAFREEGLGFEVSGVKPVGFDLPSSVWADGVGAPFLSSPSVIFSDRVVEIKPSKRCPSGVLTISDRDLTTCAIHSKVRNLPVQIVYATIKKHALYTLPNDMLEASWRALIVDAMAMQNFVRAAESREHALSMVPVNLTNFRWDDELLEKVQGYLALSKEKMNAIKNARTSEGFPDGGRGGDIPWDLLSSD